MKKLILTIFFILITCSLFAAQKTPVPGDTFGEHAGDWNDNFTELYASNQADIVEYGCDLAVAVAALGSVTPVTLNVECEVIVASGTTITITDNIALNVRNGGSIDGVAGGPVETINTNGPFNDGIYKKFGVNLTVTGLSKVEYVVPQWWGAVADGIVDDYASIQKAIDIGKTVFFSSGTYLIGTGLIMETEGQILFGEGDSSVIKADAAIIMLEMKTTRYQRAKQLRFDGDSTATYGIKLNFPKCGISDTRVDGCTIAGVWMGYFSTFIDNNSRVIDNDGIGVLIQDAAGGVNDIHIRNSIVSGNAKHGIRIETGGRDGIFLSGLNMEQNASLSGYSHVSSVDVDGLYISDMYHENNMAIAGNYFYNFESSSRLISMDNIKINDSSPVTPYDYFIRVAGTGGDLARSMKISNVWAAGFAQKFIENNLNTSSTNYLRLENIMLDLNNDDDLLSSGQGVDIVPGHATLYARRRTTNQSFGTIETAVFNEGFTSTTQSVTDARLLPASYGLATGIYTVFESGMYESSGVISVTAPPAGEFFTINLYQSGSLKYGPFYSPYGNGADNVSLAYSGVYDCIPGDTLEVKITTSIGTMEMRVNGSNLTIKKIGTQFGIN